MLRIVAKSKWLGGKGKGEQILAEISYGGVVAQRYKKWRTSRKRKLKKEERAQHWLLIKIMWGSYCLYKLNGLHAYILQEKDFSILLS